MKYAILIISLTTIGFFFLKGLSIDPSVVPSNLLSHDTPSFKLEKLPQKELLQETDFLDKNNLKLLNFFATWCPPCKVEHPQLMEIAKKYALYGIAKKDRISDLILKLVALEDKANAYSRSLSGGMKRRLLIAKAMVHRPPILVLDEPTAGVDVELKQNLWNNVKKLNKQGVTIILTTHLMNEAQEMCDRIAILNKGNIVKLDTTDNLLNSIKTKKIIFKVKKTITINPKDLDGIKLTYNSNNEVVASYERNKHKIDEIISKIKSVGMEIYDISTDEGDLEDVFIDLTKS